jgi:hypothetical protein
MPRSAWFAGLSIAGAPLLVAAACGAPPPPSEPAVELEIPPLASAEVASLPEDGASAPAPPSASAEAPLADPPPTADSGAPRPPTIRQGTTKVTGRLPPEVIQRIVRQNFGRFRLCYENGLRTDPDLTGQVKTRFVIDAGGDVISAADAGSDLPDPTAVGCVLAVFRRLAFPMPEGGAVTVVYPLRFIPGDPPAKPAAKPTATPATTK